jgi:hypothetical protein
LIKGDRSCCDIKWGQSPTWNPALRRTMSIFLLCRKITKMILNDNMFASETELYDSLPQLSRKDALKVFEIDHMHKTSEQTIKNRIIQLIAAAVHESKKDYFMLILSSVKTLYPSDVASLIHEWNIDTHKYFPETFKERVVKFLCCCTAFETRKTLGLLPEVLVQKIVGMMALASSSKNVDETIVSLEKHNAPIERLYQMQSDQIFNKLLGMRLNVQNFMVDFMHMNSTSETQNKVLCFFNYVKDRAGTTVNYDMQEVVQANFASGAKGYRIVIKYTPMNIEDPPNDVKIYRHEKSGRMMWIYGKRMMFTDGSIHISDTSEEFIFSRGYTESCLMQWRVNARKTLLIAQKKVQKLHKVFFIATEHAMNNWEKSMQKVLRIPTSVYFPRGAIGLLIQTQK